MLTRTANQATLSQRTFAHELVSKMKSQAAYDTDEYVRTFWALAELPADLDKTSASQLIGYLKYTTAGRACLDHYNYLIGKSLNGFQLRVFAKSVAWVMGE